MARILIDFDGTIAKTNQYHKVGWDKTLQELKLSLPLDQYLPYEKGLMERYDSYRRIRDGFLNNSYEYELISEFFKRKDKDLLSHKIFDLKESHTINAILKKDPADPHDTLAINLKETLEEILDLVQTIGIISSTRRAIVYTFLNYVNLVHYFDFIRGEEDLTTEKGELMDKPNPYGYNTIEKTINKSQLFYIGDNIEIDPIFAKNIGAKFILVNYSQDFKSVISQLC